MSSPDSSAQGQRTAENGGVIMHGASGPARNMRCLQGHGRSENRHAEGEKHETRMMRAVDQRRAMRRGIEEKCGKRHWEKLRERGGRSSLQLGARKFNGNEFLYAFNG